MRSRENILTPQTFGERDKLNQRIGKLARKGLNFSRDIAAALSPSGRRLARRRSETDARLRQMASAPPGQPGRTLIDGIFDNPNYWLRVGLARAALGTTNGEEIGVTGHYRAREVRQTFNMLGIANVVSFDGVLSPSELEDARILTDRLCAQSKSADDIIAWELPESYPGAMVYDAILKRQRSAAVDVNHPQFREHAWDSIRSVFAACALLDSTKPDHVLLSHCVNDRYGPLAWIAARRGISATVLFGQYGTSRFYKLTETDDLFRPFDCPNGDDIAALGQETADGLAQLGRDYLTARTGGKGNDIGSQYAFAHATDRLDREAICAHFNWPVERPIMAVYASNWFDFPHFCGMSNFRDFLDWMEVTLSVARERDDVSWLLRPHPCDEWYGGVTLSDLVEDDLRAHLGVSPFGWNGSDVMNAVDGLITCMGTAGIEYAAAGKPALLADRGWYHDANFTVWAESRAAYTAHLKTNWWQDGNREDAARQAEIFAGWYFSRPAWQTGFLTLDDSMGNQLYETLPALIDQNQTEIEREVQLLRDWFHGTTRLFNLYKMRKTH